MRQQDMPVVMFEAHLEDENNWWADSKDAPITARADSWDELFDRVKAAACERFGDCCVMMTRVEKSWL